MYRAQIVSIDKSYSQSFVALLYSDENINFTLNIKKHFNHWKRIGAFAPSSHFLAERMATFVPKDARIVIELGAGAGSVTRKLLDRVRSDAIVIAIEEAPELVLKLRTINDSRLVVVCESAARIDATVKRLGFDYVDCVVSGLPLSTLPKNEDRAILDSTRKVLRFGGVFIQFQYFLGSFGLIRKYFPNVTIASYVFRNIPPAFVYVAKKES